MLKSYLIYIYRTLLRNRIYTIINVSGLSLGIACSIVLFLIINYNLSFDNYHSNADKVYRVVTENHQYDEVAYDRGVPYPAIQYIIDAEYPEVEHATILDYNIGAPVLYTEHDGEMIKFKEEAPTAFVHPDYFKIFDNKWLHGSPETPFSGPLTMVVTESIAKKYFDKVDVVGEVLYNEYDMGFTITGVIEDHPKNTDHFFELMMNIDLPEEYKRGDGWGWGATSSSVNFYLQLAENTDIDAFGEKIQNIINENDEAEKSFLRVQPLSELHFDDRFGAPLKGTISKNVLLSLAGIGILLIITACINFINLSTSQILKRSKEIGVRKAMGSSRLSVISGFMWETALLSLIALILAIGLVELSLGRIETITDFPLELNLLGNPMLLIFISTVFFLVVFLSGFYPAWVLSGFKPTKALKGQSVKGGGTLLRRTLIVTQLFVSQTLIIGTIIIYSQLEHFMSQPLGFSSEAVIEFEVPDTENTNFETFRTRLLQSPDIQSVTFSNTGASSNNTWGGSFTLTMDTSQYQNYAQVKFADEHYIETFKVDLITGENYLPRLENDSLRGMLVNEAFVKKVGWSSADEALGYELDIWGENTSLITGVVSDFHTQSLHSEITPVIIVYNKQFFNNGAMKVNTGNLEGALSTLQVVWEETFPKYVFEYDFLDDQIEEFYRGERSMSRMALIFAAIAIFIGCIGLFGLISFVAVQRNKEVGVRKVLGARVEQLVMMLSKDFLYMVVLGFFLAVPVTYFLMTSWLEQFSYRIQISIWVYLVGVVLTALIVFLTVGYRSFTVASSNPVNALRDE